MDEPAISKVGTPCSRSVLDPPVLGAAALATAVEVARSPCMAYGGLLVTNRHVRHDHSGIAYRERATVEHSKVTPGGTATSRLAPEGELFCRVPCQCSHRRNNVT